MSDADRAGTYRCRQNTLAEARAREKGIKLPERGRYEQRRGPMEGGLFRVAVGRLDGTPTAASAAAANPA